MESSDAINNTVIQHTSPTVTTESISKRPSKGILPGEHKFNLRGIVECPKATPRSEWHKFDLASCLTAVSELNAEIDSHSIRDCIRLGSFKKQAPHLLVLILYYLN